MSGLGGLVSLEALGAATAYVVREWGDYGYSVEGVECVLGHGVALHVLHGDGSRFVVVADRWGNCADGVDVAGAHRALCAGRVR